MTAVHTRSLSPPTSRWCALQGFVNVRDLRVPVMCAVHGAMVGGAAAIFLHTDLRVAESEATFQHGNLSRGVCPVAGYSRTLQAAIGTPQACEYYLTDQRVAAVRALTLGLVHAVCVGVCSAKESARRAAGYVGVQSQAVTDARCTVDARLLDEEAVSHMECQHVNSGLVMTAGVQHAPLTSLTTLELYGNQIGEDCKSKLRQAEQGRSDFNLIV